MVPALERSEEQIPQMEFVERTCGGDCLLDMGCNLVYLVRLADILSMLARILLEKKEASAPVDTC